MLQPKVLVADDSLMMRRLLESCLCDWGYQVVTARDGGEAWDLLSSADPPRIAILDWMMPVHSGLELCQLVRGQERVNYTYVILLTSKSLREEIVEGLSAGADDYVVKPFDRHELEVRIRAGRRIVDLQAALLAAQEALRVQATRDPLLGIWNRASILEILDRELARACREQRPLGLAMLDVDHFKEVNDTFGHQIGDAILVEVASRVQAAVRAYDSFGRYGGEEFLLVLPGCDQAGLESHADRLRQTLAASPFVGGGQEVSLTASFGLSVAAPGRPMTSDQLISAADDALLTCKRLGRNRVVLSRIVAGDDD